MAKKYISKVYCLDHQPIIDYYLSGRSQVETGNAFGICYSTVKKICLLHNVPLRSKGESQRIRHSKTPVPDFKDELIRLYLKGNSGRECGELIGISSARALYWLKRWEVPMRKKISPTKWDKLPAKAIIRSYVDEELSLSEVGFRFGVSLTTIKKVLIKNGVSPRSSSEGKRLATEKRSRIIAEANVPEKMEVPETSLLEQIRFLRVEKDAMVQDIAVSLDITTVEVVNILQSEGLL